jgi:hypothetical protein
MKGAKREPAMTMPPAKVEDNTLDEQHAGISEKTFPVTDNDPSVVPAEGLEPTTP